LLGPRAEGCTLYVDRARYNPSNTRGVFIILWTDGLLFLVFYFKFLTLGWLSDMTSQATGTNQYATRGSPG